jgi:PhnB protein
MSAIDPSAHPLTLTPHITVKGAAEAIAFYIRVFGAVERFRLTDPTGHVGHAELQIGDGEIYLNDESPSFGALAPPTIGGTPIRLHLYVADVDAVMKTAQAAGATVLRPAEDKFYGDRAGMIADPFGHEWVLATRKEAVTAQDMQKRYDQAVVG